MNKQTTGLMGLLLVGVMALTACEKQGPAEEVGEKIDNAAESAKENMEEAGSAVEKKVEELGDKVEDATE